MRLELIKEKRLKNGDSVFTFELDDDFKNIIETKYKKKYSVKSAKLFILEGLKTFLSNELDKAFEKAKKINNITENKK